jgi:hypothetical protein
MIRSSREAAVSDQDVTGPVMLGPVTADRIVACGVT